MDDTSFSPEQRSNSLLTRSRRICDTATTMKCIHDACAKTIGKKNQVLFTAIIILNAATAFLLASGLREMVPRMVGIVAAVLSALGAACTGFALSFDYKGKAARHSELATCYATLSLSCESDRDRFREGRLDDTPFDTILGCDLAILKELQLRSHGLDSSCVVGIDGPANQPLQPTSGIKLAR